jgi:hypothetical protein
MQKELAENLCVKALCGKKLVANRKRMMEVCPKVDFYISSHSRTD